MLFVAAAVAGGLITAAAAPSSGAPGPETLALARRVTALLLNLYAMRMAAVFSITTVTIALKTGIIRRWLGYVGYGAALVLLVGIGFSPWTALVFPAWILALSIDILLAGSRVGASLPGGEAET
jgi:hypothetical protein